MLFRSPDLRSDTDSAARATGVELSSSRDGLGDREIRHVSRRRRTAANGRGAVMSVVVEKEVRCRGWLFAERTNDGVLMALVVF